MLHCRVWYCIVLYLSQNNILNCNEFIWLFFFWSLFFFFEIYAEWRRRIARIANMGHILGKKNKLGAISNRVVCKSVSRNGPTGRVECVPAPLAEKNRWDVRLSREIFWWNGVQTIVTIKTYARTSWKWTSLSFREKAGCSYRRTCSFVMRRWEFRVAGRNVTWIFCGACGDIKICNVTQWLSA